MERCLTVDGFQATISRAALLLCRLGLSRSFGDRYTHRLRCVFLLAVVIAAWVTQLVNSGEDNSVRSKRGVCGTTRFSGTK